MLLTLIHGIGIAYNVHQTGRKMAKGSKLALNQIAWKTAAFRFVSAYLILKLKGTPVSFSSLKNCKSQPELIKLENLRQSTYTMHSFFCLTKSSISAHQIISYDHFFHKYFLNKRCDMMQRNCSLSTKNVCKWDMLTFF